jgi:hypothetical protein
MTLTITTISHYVECRDLFVVKLNVIMLSVIMLNVNMLNVIMLSAVVPPTVFNVSLDITRNVRLSRFFLRQML